MCRVFLLNGSAAHPYEGPLHGKARAVKKEMKKKMKEEGKRDGKLSLLKVNKGCRQRPVGTCFPLVKGTSERRAPGWEAFTSCLVATQLAGRL